MSLTTIRNARIVNEGRIVEGDLEIERGRIAAIGTSYRASTREIDADGAWLIPGMIDDQVHFREPGFEHKGTIATESRAAVAGGITSYMEMPNCNPQTIDRRALDDKHARAAKSSLANYAFYLGATNDNLEEIKRVDPRRACGIKVFMGASTGNMLVDRIETLEGIFASTPLVIATHCEHTPTIQANEAAARARFGSDVPVTEHPAIRSVESCFLSSSLAVELARKHGARLHVLHLTTAREMALFEPGPMASKQITAEVCVHHLYFDASWYPVLGNAIKCNPAIKSAADRDALLAAVVDGRIDVIATDHAPHTQEEKARRYLEAPSGLPLLQHALLVLVELVRAGKLTIEQVVEKTAHAPAQRFEVKDRGFIREGYWADLVLLDPRRETDVDATPVLSKCGWTPFRGHVFRSRVASTFVNGDLVYDAGAIVSEARGRALEFARK